VPDEVFGAVLVVLLTTVTALLGSGVIYLAVVLAGA
jgi:hypothetical protein